jgi:predicted ester cyclase
MLGNQSQQVVERYIKEALAGGSTEVLEATASNGHLKQFLPVFWSAFADRRITVHQIFTSADGHMVACTISMEASHVGPWLGIPPTGKVVTLECTGLVQVADGKIADLWVTWDWLPLLP